MNRSVNRQYSAVQIKTANKGKLIVLLYQGAVRFMRKALMQLDAKDMEAKGNSLIRAQDIVLELMYALDEQLLQDGNELAQNLQRLYLYCYRRLVHANTHLDRAAIEEVVELFNNLLDAWEQVANQSPDGPPAAEHQTVALTG